MTYIVIENCIKCKYMDCVEVCPVDCIDKIADPDHPGYAMGVCTIDLPVCIGCKLCAQVCPWDVITMVPTEDVLHAPQFADLVPA